ncbi:hypothetical protein [Microcoleus sp. B5-D4]|uniref:hypothetical protein n=1 Tax=Microcoleus sp. B5-D4 TaxID=2818681 RepID=UPI002FCEBD51
MKIARIIGWQIDSTLLPTMKRGFYIIPAQPELISETGLMSRYLVIKQYFSNKPGLRA